MYLAHDSTHNFYYYGEEEPKPGLYTKYITENSHHTIAVDVETISLKDRTAIGVGVAINPNVAFYFPLFPEESSYTPWHLLRDPAIAKVFQNAPFDLLSMRRYDLCNDNVKDTNVIGHLLSISPSRLIDLVAHAHMYHGGRLLEVHDAKELLNEHNTKTMLGIPSETVAMKCCQDCLGTLEVYNKLLPQVDQEYFKVEMEALSVLVDMSFMGLLIDHEVRANIEAKLEKEVDYYNRLCDGEGFSPSSPQQVGYILAKRGAYNVFSRIPFTRGGKKTGKKQLDTSEEILNKMTDPMATIVLRHRSSSKLLSTYIKPWANDRRAYTRFHLDAITGRPSSTDRNMQNIPKGEPRGIFIPDSGVFTDVDFSQVELRVLAYLSQDREMIRILSDPDGDIHGETADFMSIVRLGAKKVGFSMIYGATDETIAENAGVPISRARDLKDAWFEKYNGAGYWINTVQEESLRYPYATTVFGRKIRLPTIEDEREDAIKRKAVNYPIQATAAEILKRALIRCKGLNMVLQVHDEILFDGRVVVPKLDDIAPFWTPVEVKYLQRWE